MDRFSVYRLSHSRFLCIFRLPQSNRLLKIPGHFQYAALFTTVVPMFAV
jgi:hypothetical protein